MKLFLLVAPSQLPNDNGILLVNLQLHNNEISDINCRILSRLLAFKTMKGIVLNFDLK